MPECKYGHALRRFLHCLSDMRSRHPSTPILITKTDMDAAYRRIHSAMSSAVTCITVLNDLAYLLTRLPFGSSPAPAIFSIISDGATDLANDLASDPTWDTNSLQSRYTFLENSPALEHESIPFHPADSLLVQLPPRDVMADNFLDDIFMAGVAIQDNIRRIIHAVPLALECLFKPPHRDDATPRSEIINQIKHIAEGQPAEVKIILGWCINTRTFRIHLTKHKYNDWISDTTRTVQHKHCTKGMLETLIGRFNHVDTIIHIARYFLTRLRYRLHQHQHDSKSSRIRLAPWDIEDLKLWQAHLTHLHLKGASINNICIVKPSATTYSDACEWGLGGFTSQGNTWRYRLPTHLQQRASINLLEFMAAIVTIKLSLDHDKHDTEQPHILAFTDNSSAVGWMYHSTFNPVKDPQHDATARYLANMLLQHDASLHPSHIRGVHNEIADCLSRDFQLDNSQLLHLLSHSQDTKYKIPHNMTFHQPSKTITSWIVSTLQSLPLTKPTPPQQQPSTTAVSFFSKNSSRSATSKTPSSTHTIPTKDHSSCVVLPTVLGKTTTNHLQRLNLQAPQSLPPSPTWFRPSGRTFGPIPPLTTLEQNQSFSQTN